jgi:hypothetical protein
MRHLAKRIVLPLFLLYCMHPVSGLACAILTPEQAAEQHQRAIEEFKAKVMAMKEEADLIFEGRLSRLSSRTQEVTSPSGEWQLQQKFQAVFDIVDDIKGLYPKGQLLEFTTVRNRITVGCAPEFLQLPKENGAGARYLVYARDGKILRTNYIPTDTQVLDGRAEAAFIRGEQP